MIDLYISSYHSKVLLIRVDIKIFLPGRTAEWSCI